MDIEKLANDTLVKVTEEKLSSILEQNAERLLNKVVEDMFTGYSDFAKKLKSKLQEKLNISLDNMELKDYNEFVCDKIISLVTKEYIDKETDNIEGCIREALGEPFPNKLSLEDIVEKFKSYVINDSYDEESGEISFHCEVDKENNWTVVTLDKNPDVSADCCRYRLLFNNDRGSLVSVRMRAEFRRDEPLSAFKVNNYNDWQMFILRLKNACHVEIDLDDSCIDTEWFKYGEDY